MYRPFRLPIFAVTSLAVLGSLNAQSDQIAKMMAKMRAERILAEGSWRNASFHVAYGDVAVGQHGLHELPVGKDWRMGKNYASSMETNVPLLQGDDIITPGSYRVKILHQEKGKLSLLVEGAAYPVSALPLSKESKDFAFPGKTIESKASDITKKLHLGFKDAAKTKLPSYETALQLRFGKSGLDVPLTAVDVETAEMEGHKLSVFKFPAKMLEQRIDKKLQTPIASLQAEGDETVYNLVIAKGMAKLVPQMSAPETKVGFGKVVLPEEDKLRTGKIVWSRNRKKSPVLTLDMPKKKRKSKGLQFVFTIGKRKAKITF